MNIAIFSGVHGVIDLIQNRYFFNNYTLYTGLKFLIPNVLPTNSAEEPEKTGTGTSQQRELPEETPSRLGASPIFSQALTTNH